MLEHIRLVAVLMRIWYDIRNCPDYFLLYNQKMQSDALSFP